jgi:hypothetical protein
MPIAPIDEAIAVTIVDGEVVFDGPNGFSGSMTPAAAKETARRIAAAIDEIEGGGDGAIYQKPLG